MEKREMKGKDMMEHSHPGACSWMAVLFFYSGLASVL